VPRVGGRLENDAGKPALEGSLVVGGGWLRICAATGETGVHVASVREGEHGCGWRVGAEGGGGTGERKLEKYRLVGGKGDLPGVIRRSAALVSRSRRLSIVIIGGDLAG
jgi:hypothetical protein